MLISEIRDEIISEIGGDTSDTELQTKILGFMKAALRRFPRHTRNRMIRGTKSGTLSAAATTMSLPSGVVSIEKAYFEDEGKRVEIVRPKLDRFTEEYRGEGVGQPQFFIVRQGTVEFNRKNDASRTIYFEAMIEIDSISAGDTWLFSSDRAEILKDGAKWYYFTYQEDEVKEAEWKGNFLGGLKELEAEYLREEIPDHVEEAE